MSAIAADRRGCLSMHFTEGRIYNPNNKQSAVCALQSKVPAPVIETKTTSNIAHSIIAPMDKVWQHILYIKAGAKRRILATGNNRKQLQINVIAILPAYDEIRNKSNIPTPHTHQERPAICAGRNTISTKIRNGQPIFFCYSDGNSNEETIS